MFLFKVEQPALVSVIMFSRANVRVLGFLPDLQGWGAVVDKDLAVEARMGLHLQQLGICCMRLQEK